MKKVTLLGAILFGCVSYAQEFTSFEEPAIFSGNYTDTGDPNVAHDLVNNTGEPLVNFTTTQDELGFNARYEPYDTPGTGLTDGDKVGVTDDPPNGSEPYPDGLQGYQIGDVDGNFILEFDTVALTGANSPSLSIDYFLSETGYEGDGTINASGSDRLRIYVKDITNGTEIDIIDTTGNDINDLGIEGSWITGVATLLPDTTIQLVIEVRCNSTAEAFYFDAVSIDGILSVKNYNNELFSLYPNPSTKGLVTIASKIEGEKNIIVFDIIGKQLINTTIINEPLNISALTSGVYLVKISQGTASATKKLVVK